jgi:hypothetical protein
VKIFVAYGYNDRDKWIREMVFLLIEAFGSEVETGEETYESSIPESVKSKIRRSDALMAFTTRRTTQDNQVWQTHRWVVEELAAAAALGKKTVEVRETGVEQQGGLTQANQRIEYDEAARDKCLVEIVKALGVWHSTDYVQVQLLPEGVANNDLRPLLEQQGLICQYVVKVGNYEDSPVDAEIKGIKGGLFINVQKPERDALVKINLRFGNRVWRSDYESLDSYGIHLR